MTRNRNISPSKLIFFSAILIIGVGQLLANIFAPHLGDDLYYGEGMRLYYEGRIAFYPRWILRHWTMVNGRFANLAAPLLLYYSPRWILLALSAIATAAMYWLSARCAKTSRPMLLIAIIFFAFPWWDSMWLFDVQFNYIWASTLGLATIYLTFQSSASPSRWAPVIAFIAGGMHEAMSMPLLIGIAAYLIIGAGFKSLSSTGKWTVILFAASTAITLLSPGILHRAIDSVHSAADDSMPILLLKSAPITLAFILLLIGYTIARPQRIASLSRTPWIIFAVASIISLGFCAAGGIVGRSGWFSSLFALIAGFMLIDFQPLTPRKAITISAILLALITAFTIHHLAWQRTTGLEYRKAIQAYSQSTDGAVYLDITTVDQLPPSTLCRVATAPDIDDLYLRQSITDCLGDTLRPFIILPASLQGATIHTQIPRCRIVTDAPSTDSQGIFGTQRDSIAIPLPGTTPQLILIAPRPLNPGDR